MGDTETIIHFWQTFATVSLGILVTLLGFWVGIGRKIISKEEIVEMVHNETPYAKDRQFIMERLSSHKESQIAFSLVLQRNSDIMNELKIQLATLSKTLETLETNIENNRR